MSLGIQSVPASLPSAPALRAWRDQVRAAAADSTPLNIVGGGSKAFYGRPLPAGASLDTRQHAGILAYEPTELVITVRGGTPLAEVDAALAERGQFLAFEPPRFGGAPTIGGAVATGLSGPRRMSAGAVRDAILGVRLLDGHGNLLSFGGQVMKNVAGYDVSRLLAGSLGCLGVLAELSIKVLPQPRVEATLRFAMNQETALAHLNQWSGQPLPLSASAWQDDQLHVRLSGAQQAVDAARAKLGGQLLDPAAASALWDGLRDQSAAFFTPADQVLVRLAVPDTTPALTLPGQPLIEWGGAQRWYHADAAALPELRRLAGARGGHATAFRASGVDDVFTPLPEPLLRIHRALKQALDPAGIFNRGRMYKEI